ncbi:MAG: DUF1700 domain-containing protein [Bdellovibrionaceae bacterium]|nr:DUF1700 domain-containing protein [Pseudobdellovibrionaceae bacterium]
MTKQEFLRQLKTELESNQIRNISDILADYEEHFNHAQVNGKSEPEITASLGLPVTIAQAYKTDHMIQEIKNTENKFQWSLAINIIGRLIILAPFNFIVLFIPGIIIFALLTAGWSMSLAIGSLAFGILWNLPSLLNISSTFWMGLAGISTTIGFFGLGIIGVLTMFFITKHIVLALISYLQWNLKFVMEK